MNVFFFKMISRNLIITPLKALVSPRNASHGTTANQVFRPLSTKVAEQTTTSQDASDARKMDERFNKRNPYLNPLRKSFKDSILPPNWQEMRFKYPEFLPSIEQQQKYRNTLREKLERRDMLNRRSVIDIPEFYVGSILRVEVSDHYANGKVSKFTGICIQREGQGLRAVFALRNVIEGEGVEIRYDMYNPTIRNIEVLKLEKRLDNHLLYLRDALPEYSTLPENMVSVTHQEGAEVPVNKILVKMKPRPWGYMWEKYDFRGIEKMEDIPEYMYNKYRDPKKGYHSKRKYDTMLLYRKHVTEDEQYDIWQDVERHEKNVVDLRRTEKRKRVMQEQLRTRFAR